MHNTKTSNDFWRDQLSRNPPVVDPGTRIWEIVCGLIMVLTFTGSISAATAARQDVKVILWASMGCNAAWGIVDALMYLMGVWLERDQAVKALHKVRKEPPAVAVEVIKQYLPPIITRLIQEKQIEDMRNELIKLPEPPLRAYLLPHDIKNAVLIFFLVFLSTFPVAIPFLFKIDLYLAMRLSNGIVLSLLFACGLFLGGQTGYRQILLGLLLALIGAVLVSIVMALGG